MADEEPVDPKHYLEETCKPKCVRPLRAYQLPPDPTYPFEVQVSAFYCLKKACVERIKEDETGHKHCTGQYFDYWKCIDDCAALKLFEKLK